MMAVIEITDEDIKLGIYGNCSCCPVARAVSRHIGEEFKPWVTADQIKIVSCHGRREFDVVDVPDSVGEFVKRFDEWASWNECYDREERQAWLDNRDYSDETPDTIYVEDVEPFSFEISIPVEAQEQKS